VAIVSDSGGSPEEEVTMAAGSTRTERDQIEEVVADRTLCHLLADTVAVTEKLQRSRGSRTARGGP
jgi:hypothetical protein